MADTYKVVQPNANGPKGPFFLGQEIELDSVPAYLVGKVELVKGKKTLEIATPEPEAVPESGSDYEEELRAFILDKTGKNAGGNCKIATLEKQAKKLGWSK
jgi:hypothetical protein